MFKRIFVLAPFVILLFTGAFCLLHDVHGQFDQRVGEPMARPEPDGGVPVLHGVAP